MRISVVTPSFNQAQFLRSTLESVHGAEYSNLEHIVIDGGSNDGSVEIISEYADRLAYWVSEPDNGQTDALIKGFGFATGDILCWLNSDDLFEPWTLREVAEVFDRDPSIAFAFGDSTWIDRAGGVVKRKREHAFNRFVWLNDHNFIPQPSAFWRADLYREVGGLCADFDLAMDADLWARFAEHTRPRHIRRPWSRMRIYPEQKTSARRSQSLAELESIRSRYMEVSGPARGAKRVLARTARIGLKLAIGAYSVDDVLVGARSLFWGSSWEETELMRSPPNLE